MEFKRDLINMAKSGSFRFGYHRFPDKAPDCSYLGSGIPCVRFNFNLLHGICLKNNVRCKYMPDWAISRSHNLYAILKDDGCLHVSA